MISTFDPKEQYLGNGSVSAYTFNFKITSLSQIVVVIENTSGVETQRTRGTSAPAGIVSSIAFDATAGGGTVTLTGNLTSGYTIAIILSPDSPTQDSRYRNQGDFTLPKIEASFDSLALQIQRAMYLGLRSGRLYDLDDVTDFDPMYPSDLVGSVNKVLMTNDDGDGWLLSADSVSKTDLEDAITSAANADISEAAAAASATSAATSATAAASSATSAATSATAAATSSGTAATSATSATSSASAASTSATAAASSASAASTSATNAATSASGASTSATAAASSASSASTSATSAGTSATNAATSETNAATSATSAATSATSASTSSSLAQDWATKTTATVGGIDYSSKEYAVGVLRRGAASGGSAKDWASYVGGTVDDTYLSARAYALQALAVISSGVLDVQGLFGAPITFANGATLTLTASAYNNYWYVARTGGAGVASILLASPEFEAQVLTIICASNTAQIRIADGSGVNLVGGTEWIGEAYRSIVLLGSSGGWIEMRRA